MRTEKFKTLFDFSSKSNVKAGDGLDGGNFPFYTSSSILKKRIDKAQHFDEALIFGTGGSASVHFAGEPFATSTDCIVAITKHENINAKFVYYYLFGNIHLLERGFKGAGLKHISKKYIENLDIPTLPIETQNKIVAVLDKTNSLISKREESISLVNELLRAIFLNMFGDPIINPKAIKTIKLGAIEHFQISGGGTPTRTNEDYFGGDIPWITPKDMKKEMIDNSKIKLTELGLSKSTGKLVDELSIIIVVRSGILKHTFPIALNTKKVTINQDLKAIKPLSTLPYFTYWNIKLHESFLLNKVRAVTADNIDTNVLRDLNLLNPDLSSQTIFEEIAKKYYSLALKYDSLISENKSLMSSILQNIFNDTLTLNDKQYKSGNLNLSVDLSLNIDFELDVLLKEINLLEKINDLSKIESNPKYLNRLIEKLNNQEFKEKSLYDKAKHGAFQLMTVKEEERKITQEYDDKRKSLRLTLK